MSPVVLEADKDVVVMTASFAHQHIGQLFRALRDGRTVQVTTTPGAPYVRIKAVQDA